MRDVVRGLADAPISNVQVVNADGGVANVDIDGSGAAVTRPLRQGAATQAVRSARRCYCCEPVKH